MSDELSDVRDAMERPVVDTESPNTGDAGGEVEGVGKKDKDLVISFENGVTTVSIGSASTTLDREGVFGAQRHFNQIAGGL